MSPCHHIQPFHCPFVPLVFMSLYPVSPEPHVSIFLCHAVPCVPLSLCPLFLTPHSPAVPYPCPPYRCPTYPCGAHGPRQHLFGRVPTRVLPVVALSPQGSGGDTAPAAPLQYRRGASSTGGAMEPPSRSGLRHRSSMALRNEPNREEGNPRTQNDHSTPGAVPRLVTARKRQNSIGIKFRVMKHSGHGRKGRYGGRWCVLTPPAQME